MIKKINLKLKEDINLSTCSELIELAENVSLFGISQQRNKTTLNKSTLKNGKLTQLTNSTKKANSTQAEDSS